MKQISDQLLDRISERLKAMGNPVRLRILHALEQGELPVHEILVQVGGSQANISKHLNVLRAADLLSRRRDGNSIYYGIRDEAVLGICRTVCDSLLDRAHEELESIAEARSVMLAGNRT